MSTVQVGSLFPDLVHNERHLPPGSEIRYQGNAEYRFRVEGPADYANLSRYGEFDSYGYGNPIELVKLPDGSDQLALPDESLDEFLWRIRDAALAAAERSSVTQGPVLQMLDRIGAGQPRLGVGGVVANHHDVSMLPIGAVLYYGNLHKRGKYAVFTHIGNGSLECALGQRRSGWPLMIEDGPGLVELKPGPVASPEQLAKTAARARRIGKVFKQRQSWCSTFESTMTCLGFTEKMLALAEGDGPTPGDEVAGNEQIAALPEGTLLYWAFRTGGNAVYVRDDSARNMAKTRRVWGHDDSEQNSHTRMVVAKLPGEEESFMHWRVVGRVLDRMPTGVRYLNASGVERTLGDGHPVSIYDSYTVVDWAVF